MLLVAHSDASCTAEFDYSAAASIIVNAKGEYVDSIIRVYSNLTAKLAELQGLVQVLEKAVEPGNILNNPRNRIRFLTDSMYVLNIFDIVLGIERDPDTNPTKLKHCSAVDYEEEKYFKELCERYGVNRIEVKHTRSHQRNINLNKTCDLLVKMARSAAQEDGLVEKAILVLPEEQRPMWRVVLRGKLLLDASPSLSESAQQVILGKEVRDAQSFE